jgi:uncharacterized protein YukE
MEIKIEYANLGQIGNDLISNSDEINLIKKNIKALNVQITNNWNGIDATMFLAKGETYLNQIKNLTEQLNACGTLINDAVANYQEIEEEYKTAVSS